MISTFHGIEVGKRVLQVHQQGMHVIEHNVANANTETPFDAVRNMVGDETDAVIVGEVVLEVDKEGDDGE